MGVGDHGDTGPPALLLAVVESRCVPEAVMTLNQPTVAPPATEILRTRECATQMIVHHVSLFPDLCYSIT